MSRLLSRALVVFAGTMVVWWSLRPEVPASVSTSVSAPLFEELSQAEELEVQKSRQRPLPVSVLGAVAEEAEPGPLADTRPFESCFALDSSGETNVQQWWSQNQSQLQKKVLRQVSSFASGDTEIRVVLRREKNQGAWRRQAFSVDSDGFPKFLNEEFGEGPSQLLQDYKKKKVSLQPLGENEMFLEVEGENISGSLYFVGDRAVEVDLVSRSEGLALKCLGDSCECEPG